ncbi:MAG: DUF262 domain-containing protein [Bacteroidetes bacterium]|nr:DUF262 domain-containing protein [Bacteroidota bacterium]
MELDNENIPETIPEENNDSYVNDDLYNISSWGADYSFRELVSLYDEDDLVKPELQRKYVWEKPEASRFIDSILLGLPIPSIFLAKTEENKMLIIDGYQRLMTVNDYVKGIWSGDNSVFTLSNIPGKINHRWKGKAYNQLSESEQRKIKTTTIHAIIFEQKQPKDDDTSLYQIFERINTSGKSLMPQEIRNCVYQGNFNTLLFQLNNDVNWRLLYGNPKEDSRMRDLEFILRFFALKSNEVKDSKKGSISLKKLLNEFMGAKGNNYPRAVLNFGQEFTSSILAVKNQFGENAFFNVQSNDLTTIRKRFYPTVYDSIMIATAIALEKGVNTSKSNETNRLALLRDDKFREYSTQGTMQVEHINGRIELALKHLYNLQR